MTDHTDSKEALDEIYEDLVLCFRENPNEEREFLYEAYAPLGHTPTQLDPLIDRAKEVALGPIPRPDWIDVDDFVRHSTLPVAVNCLGAVMTLRDSRGHGGFPPGRILRPAADRARVQLRVNGKQIWISVREAIAEYHRGKRRKSSH